MQKIAILNSDESLNHKILSFCNDLGSDFEPVFLRSETKCLEYLNYELPEISVLNFMDTNINMDSVLERIKSDPWLHYGGIIAICDNKAEIKLLKEEKNINIISIIQKVRFDFIFPRTIRIVKQNRQILFQRHIQNQFFQNISGAFIIDNDPFDVVTYAHLVSNYLYNSNYIDHEGRVGLHLALQELLMNAIEHGNCRIDNEEKNKWLNEDRDIFDLIRQKNSDPKIREKKVYFEYSITAEESTFTITDEGEGFDWKKTLNRLDEEEVPMLNRCGRGIRMSMIYVKDLKYNDKGNEVSFILQHQKLKSNVVPGAFFEQEEIIFHDDEIICHEGEESNFLYYIVSGKLNILYNDKIVAYLTPADIFLGEMSFLLNNKRSATVKSDGTSKLLKISKQDFLNAIKKNPHYGIFLARLLAQRIDRLNQLSAGVKTKGSGS